MSVPTAPAGYHQWRPHPGDVRDDHALRTAAAEVGLDRPAAAPVMQALTEYNLFSPDELAALEKEIPL